MKTVEVNFEQLDAIYSALQCFVRFEEPAEHVPGELAFIVRDRTSTSGAAVKFTVPPPSRSS